jgi:hypothetical protein
MWYFLEGRKLSRLEGTILLFLYIIFLTTTLGIRALTGITGYTTDILKKITMLK